MVAHTPIFTQAPSGIHAGLPKAPRQTGAFSRALPFMFMGGFTTCVAAYAIITLRRNLNEMEQIYAQKSAAEEVRKKALEAAYGDRDSLLQLEEAMRKYEASKHL